MKTVLLVIATVLVAVAALVLLFNGSLGHLNVVGIAWLGVALFIGSFLVP